MNFVVVIPARMASTRLFGKSLADIHGRSMIAIGREPIDQINLTVDGSDPSAPMGLWRVGDRCRITTREWLTIEDGDHDLLIIAASGDPMAAPPVRI